MTKRERDAKIEISNILMKEGHVTYSKLFDLFDLNLTKDPNVVGYMEPGKARIVVNENLDIDQVSFVVRHEILHEYLDHQLRMQRHMGDDNYNNRSSSVHQLINMAADYEISNRGYTAKDKKTAKHLKLGDKEVQGLVTELDHPEWGNAYTVGKLTMEEMFDKLMDEYEKNKDQMEQQLQQMANSGLDIGSGAGSAQQQMEDIERKAQEQAESEAEQGNDSKADQNQQIAKAAGQAADDAKEMNSKDDKVFDSEKEQKEKEELAKRIEAIKKAFSKAASDKSIESEDEEEQEKRDLIQQARDADRYNKDPLQRFKLSLSQFIKKETAVGRGPTWNKFNKTYANTNLIKPGTSRLSQNKVPLINVYFDRSMSWDDAKTKDGERAMAFLNDYVRQGKIKINLYYFSNNVHGGANGKAEAEREGGTEGQPILDHIKDTKPDNVIIMTDSDIDDCYSDVKVPGAVYFLFKDGESSNLMGHLKGQRITQKFDI